MSYALTFLALGRSFTIAEGKIKEEGVCVCGEGGGGGGVPAHRPPQKRNGVPLISVNLLLSFI